MGKLGIINCQFIEESTISHFQKLLISAFNKSVNEPITQQLIQSLAGLSFVSLLKFKLEKRNKNDSRMFECYLQSVILFFKIIEQTAINLSPFFWNYYFHFYYIYYSCFNPSWSVGVKLKVFDSINCLLLFSVL